MDESDPGVELRVPRQALFETGHSDQHDANFAGIEDGPHLLKTGHAQTVRLVNQNEHCRVGDPCIREFKLSGHLTLGWLKFRQERAQPIMLSEKLGFVLLVTSPNGVKMLLALQS
jgi:hypothetical protein